METVQFVIALLAILASVISITVFNRVRKQYDLLSSGCWNGEVILEFADGSEMSVQEGQDLDFSRRSQKGSKEVEEILPIAPIRAMRFCGCTKYLPRVYVSAGPSKGVVYLCDYLHDGQRWPFNGAHISFEPPLTLEQRVCFTICDGVIGRDLCFDNQGYNTGWRRKKY